MIFARELAVGARSLDDDSLEDSLDDEEPLAVAPEARLADPVRIFLDPMLPTADSLFEEENEDRVPIEDTPPLFEETPAPARELFRLVLIKLLLEEDTGAKEGRGDLARKEEVPVGPFGFSFSSRRDGTRPRPELLTATEGRAVPIDEIFLGATGAE